MCIIKCFGSTEARHASSGLGQFSSCRYSEIQAFKGRLSGSAWIGLATKCANSAGDEASKSASAHGRCPTISDSVIWGTLLKERVFMQPAKKVAATSLLTSASRIKLACTVDIIPNSRFFSNELLPVSVFQAPRTPQSYQVERS